MRETMVREVGPAALPRDAVEMATLLSDLGLDRKEARVLAFLHSAREAKSTQIEKAWKMRQPEVSVATKGLRERGWLTAAERRNVGRGRPVNVYRLERPLPEIVESVAQEKRRQAETEFEKIERLRKLLDDALMPRE